MGASRVACAFLVYVLPPLPGAAAGRRPRSSHPAVPAFPDNVGGTASTSSLTRLAQRSHALRPAHLRPHLNVTCYTERSSHCVTSMTAPVASGWAVAGGACTHWKAPPCHGAHAKQDVPFLYQPLNFPVQTNLWGSITGFIAGKLAMDCWHSSRPVVDLSIPRFLAQKAKRRPGYSASSHAANDTKAASLKSRWSTHRLGRSQRRMTAICAKAPMRIRPESTYCVEKLCLIAVAGR